MSTSFYSKLMLLVLLLQVAFIAAYISLLLVKMPIWIADIFCVVSGLSGIIVSFIAVKKMGKVTFLSVLIAIIGVLLLLLLLLSIGITSM